MSGKFAFYIKRKPEEWKMTSVLDKHNYYFAFPDFRKISVMWNKCYEIYWKNE